MIKDEETSAKKIRRKVDSLTVDLKDSKIEESNYENVAMSFEILAILFDPALAKDEKGIFKLEDKMAAMKHKDEIAQILGKLACPYLVDASKSKIHREGKGRFHICRCP